MTFGFNTFTCVIWQKKIIQLDELFSSSIFTWRIFIFRDRFYLANIQLNGIWLKNSFATFSLLTIENGKIGKSIKTCSILFFAPTDDNHPCTMNVFRAEMKTTLWPIQFLIFFDSILGSRFLILNSKYDFHSFSAFHNDFVWTLGSLRHRWYWFQNTLVQMDCWKIATNLFDGKFFDFIYQKLNLKTFEKKSSN